MKHKSYFIAFYKFSVTADMQDLIIIGNTPFATLIREYISDDDDIYNVKAFTVDGAYIKDSTFEGLPVIAYEEITKFFPPESVKMVCAVGYQNLGKVRKDLYSRYSDLGYEFINYIHRSAQVDKKIILARGGGNIVLENVVISKRVTIGNGNLFWPYANINHDDVIGSFNTFCGGSMLCGCVNAGDCNFFGAGSIVRDKLTIGNSNLIGAMSYVDKNIGDNTVVMPAKSVVIKNSAEILASYGI